MCRWFAYIAPSEDCLLEDVLINPAHSLSKQVENHYLPKLISHHPDLDPKDQTTESEISLRNRLLNADGFGLAYYNATRSNFVNSMSGVRPTLFKLATPPTNNANFHSLCANTSTTCLFAHIRAATSTGVVSVNNHPFTFGRHAIMHNGAVSNFPDIRRDLLNQLEKSAYENIQGTTDSEHLAALYMTHLVRSSGGTPGVEAWEKQYPLTTMKSALEATYKAIITLQRKCIGESTAQANSLNVAITDGSKAVFFRFRNHPVEQTPSLYYSTTAGITLNRKYPDHHDGTPNPNATLTAEEHGKHMIVASEPSTYKDEEWDLLKKNHCVMVDETGNWAAVEIEVGDEFDAKGATEKHA